MDIYTIKDFRIGNFEDANGNTWCTLTVEEYGEPLIWVVKDPEKTPERFALDTKIYGEIKDWTSSKGKTSARYYDHTKEQDATSVSSGKSSGKSVADYEPSTNTRWAIGMAYRAYQQVMGTPEEGGGGFPFDSVKLHASELLRMFDELKNSGSYESGQPTLSPQPIKESPVSSATASLGDTYRKKRMEPDEDSNE